MAVKSTQSVPYTHRSGIRLLIDHPPFCTALIHSIDQSTPDRPNPGEYTFQPIRINQALQRLYRSTDDRNQPISTFQRLCKKPRQSPPTSSPRRSSRHAEGERRPWIWNCTPHRPCCLSTTSRSSGYCLIEGVCRSRRA